MKTHTQTKPQSLEILWNVRSRLTHEILANCKSHRDAVLWSESPLTLGMYPDGTYITPKTETTAAAPEAPQTGKPILDALLNASESLAQPQAQHSPLPWHLHSGEHRFSIKSPWTATHKAGEAEGYGDYRGLTVCIIEHQGEAAPVVTQRQAKANAAFIVEACNNYERVKSERDALLAACEDCQNTIRALVEMFEDHPSWIKAEAAIKAAKKH